MRIKKSYEMNTYKKALINNEIPTKKETNSKTTLINLDPLIIEKYFSKIICAFDIDLGDPRGFTWYLCSIKNS